MLAIISVSAGYGTDGSSTPTIVAVPAPWPVPSLMVFPRIDRIALQRSCPEVIGQHYSARRTRTVVPHVEQTAQYRMQSHDVEIMSIDHPGANLAGLAEADQGEIDGRELAKLTQRFDALPQILDFRYRERHIAGAKAGSALPDVNQPVLVPIYEGPQQHPANQCENCRVGANAQRQRDHHRRRQPFGSPERPDREL